MDQVLTITSGSRTTMSQKFRIRQARLRDVPELLIFAHKLFGEKLSTIFTLDPLPRLADEVAFVRPYLEKKRWLLLVAEAEGIVVGVLNFKDFEHSQLRHGGEFGISVLRGWRDRGIGSKLLDRLASWAREQGFRRLELQVFANNPEAIRLYESRGFVHEGTRRGAVLVGEEYVDILYMARELT